MEFLGVSKTHFPQSKLWTWVPSNNKLNNICEFMKLVLSYEVQITCPEFWLYDALMSGNRGAPLRL